MARATLSVMAVLAKTPEQPAGCASNRDHAILEFSAASLGATFSHPDDPPPYCTLGFACRKLYDKHHMDTFLHERHVLEYWADGGGSRPGASNGPPSGAGGRGNRGASMSAQRRARSGSGAAADRESPRRRVPPPGHVPSHQPSHGQARRDQPGAVMITTQEQFEQAICEVLQEHAAIEAICLPEFIKFFEHAHDQKFKQVIATIGLPLKTLEVLKQFPHVCILSKVSSPMGPAYRAADYVRLNPEWGPGSQDSMLGRRTATEGPAPGSSGAMSSPVRQSNPEPLGGSVESTRRPPEYPSGPRQKEAPDSSMRPPGSQGQPQRQPRSAAGKAERKEPVQSEHAKLLSELATGLRAMWMDVNSGVGEIEGTSGQSAEETMLQKLADGSSKIEAVFPVYGAVKAGKSTFLSCVLRETILPAQALPMTSIPIKISHVVGTSKKLVLKQAEEWRKCLAGFKQKLIAGSLAKERKQNEGDKHLFNMQEKVRSGDVAFSEECEGDDDIASQLLTISHFVRLLWINDIDFELDYNISLEIADLPEVQLDMRAFRDGPVQRFAFLDTPGPNEAKASTALAKIGPQVMASSSGCIFCVPYDQVEAQQQYQLYVHLNRWMAGKRVIVIITKMDSFMGDITEKEGIEDSLRSFFPPVMQSLLRVHFTSGFALLALFELEQLLVEHGDNAPHFITLLKSHKSWKDMTKLWSMDYIINACAGPELAVKACRDILGDKMKELSADAVMEDFRQLYADSERIALTGHIASLKNSFSRLQESLLKVQQYISASSQEQVKMQERLAQVDEVYKNILLELDIIPKSLRESIYSLLKTQTVEALTDWCAQQAFWHIVRRGPDGTTVDAGEIVEFEGGKAEVLIWFKEEVEPKLGNAMKQKFKEIMSGHGTIVGVEAQLHDCVRKKWTACKTMLARLEELGETNVDSFLVFREPPSVTLDVESLAKEVCAFDTKVITFTQHASKVTINNSVIKQDILKGFNQSAKAAAEQITAQVSAIIEIVLRQFEEEVSLQQANAARIREQNQAIVDARTSKKDVEDMAARVEPQLSPYKDKIRSLEAKMQSSAQ
eukprot:CAMPEP_0115123452 /NCGR_PEP_ID=MMETSP0227-20121206/47546_1 /TAXON_ID=89957 /ORGANISM="Polarella glacialis, Strain CCMP 1383" /LENGTH=1066 /DNA_ID=CAMNT_0002525817 /DNA_START=72 /DNA_END=3271 /DNA_ORIENTATION=+